MFSDVLNQVTGRFDTRFLLHLFFPSLLFWAGLTLIYASTVPLDVALAHWQTQNADVQLLEVILSLAWVTFFSFLLGNQFVWLTKLFEGYWTWIPLIGQRLVSIRKKHYQNILEQLDRSKDYEAIYRGFPFPDEKEAVMPTRLGNILKNAERYAYHRYEINTVVLWPHLYAVLPEVFVKSVDQARGSLEFMLVVTTLSGSFALLAAIYLLATNGIWWLFLLCFLGGWIVAFLSYNSALEIATVYSQLVKSAFDLYRDNLRKQLGYDKPQSLIEERAFWRAVYELVYRGEAEKIAVLRYASDKGEEKKS